MLELAALTVVAAVATTFAVDILRPTLKLMMRRRTRHARVDGEHIEAHAVR